MADLTQTAANVRAGATATVSRGIAGEAISPGDQLYLATDQKLWRGSANAQPTAEFRGVAINFASTGDAVHYVSRGLCKPGATLVVGETYVVSANTGKIAPVADLVATKWVSIIGVAKTTADLDIRGNATQTQKP